MLFNCHLYSLSPTYRFFVDGRMAVVRGPQFVIAELHRITLAAVEVRGRIAFCERGDPFHGERMLSLGAAGGPFHFVAKDPAPEPRQQSPVRFVLRVLSPFPPPPCYVFFTATTLLQFWLAGACGSFLLNYPDSFSCSPC